METLVKKELERLQEFGLVNGWETVEQRIIILKKVLRSFDNDRARAKSN